MLTRLQATGCGKTHTISGTDTDPGIIYLTMTELFQRISELEAEQIVQVSVTFLEIYNEDIRDLLSEPGSYAPRGGLTLREDKSNRVVVSGLVTRCPTTADEVKQLVLDGNTRRTQSPTLANQTSSRSHAVLQVNVTQSPRTASTTECKTSATLSIIDLAGSERASATKNMGERMIEGANINKSLLALGNCINALCASGGRTRHVPYRNSKLTRLLKFSLGGNCRTVMIVCVAPTSAHYEDTQNTLKYANRAKEIKTKVSRNFLNVDRHVAQYVEAISRLNDEVAELKAKLAGRATGDSEVETRKKREAQAAALRARDEMQRKVESAGAALVDGARGQGVANASRLRLAAIRARMQQLDAVPSVSGSDSDRQAERSLLINLATREESIARGAENQLASTIRANELFETQLRSIADRKLGDDMCNEIVRLDARTKRAELNTRKAEARASVLEGTVTELGEVVAALAGVVARCSVMMMDGQSVLRNVAANENAEETTCAVASALGRIAESNGQTLFNVLGQSGVPGAGPSSLLSFTGHAATATSKRYSPPQPASRTSRRSSVAANTSISSVPSPRRFKSPRRPLSRRTSSISGMLPKGPLAPAPAPVAVAVARVPKKAVQWRDMAGEGSLDDARTAVVPEKVYPMPSAGSASETEWEDAEDSAMSIAGKEKDAEMSGGENQVYNLIAPPNPKRRGSRLDPGFLKSFGASKTLGSLAEETPRALRAGLADVSNQVGSGMGWGDVSMEAGSSTPTRKPVAVGDDSVVLPAKRVPGSATKSMRRRSGLGLAVAKARRRSSLIPTLSPPGGRPLGSSGAIGVGGPQRQRMAPLHSSPQRSPFKVRGPGIGHGRRGSAGGRASLMGVGPARAPLKAARPTIERFASDQSMDFGRPLWK
jgi:kinesin family protein 18/19